MAEETKVVKPVVEEPATTVVVEPAEPTEAENLASSFGWQPKEEWVAAGKDPEDWRSAKEFNERGELYQSLHSTKRDLKQTQATLTALQRHHQFVFEKAHQQAVDELKRDKRLAMRDQDLEAVEAIDDAIESKQKEFQAAQMALVQEQRAAAVAAQPHPEFQAWVGRNQWYQSNSEMKDDADAFGVVFMQKNPTASPAQVLQYVEGRVRKQYADQFKVRKAAPAAVSGVNRSNTAGRPVADDFEMNETEQDIMKNLVSTGVMTEAQYKAELKKAYKKG